MLTTLVLVTLCGDIPVDFSREVQPILSSHCFVCHGPDEGTRKKGLRLDLGSVVGVERGILVPHDPDTSELIRRITHSDPEQRMPPMETGDELTADEIDILTRWVSEGAVYQQHWAFRSLTSGVDDGESDWGHSPIDGFVGGELKRHGMNPSPEADRSTLIRRLSFDLCGMPPTPAEVAAFVADTTPDAYGDLVDRLLASPAYGERMTLSWMDAARYGDTSVHHADGPRDMWPWRDWVIEAYNQNMPFDQFTIEQLAGDLLPDPTLDQLVASGFHRNTPTSDEGGAIDEELRVKYMVDRVKTTGNVWLGLSVECAQCHDHKYDPFTMKDYYSFYAYFNQSVERGFQTRNGNERPLVSIPNKEQRVLLESFAESLRLADAFLAEAQPPAEGLDAWILSEREVLLQSKRPILGSWYSLGPFGGKGKPFAYNTDHGPERAGLDVTQEVAGLAWKERAADEDAKVHLLNLPNNSAQYLLRTVESTIDQSVMLALGSDDSIKVFLNGVEVFANDVGRGTALNSDQVSLSLPAGKSQLMLKIVNGGGASGYAFEMLGSGLPDAVQAALRLEAGAREAAGQAALKGHYLRAVWEPGREQVAARAALASQRDMVNAGVSTVMIMGDLPGGRQTYVLERGMYDAPRKDEAVQPMVPEHIFPLPEGAPANRLGLARWLTDPAHPLTARVTVNRYWTLLFGRGLVSSVMDFGSQGERPSHPQLLDWLAQDFIQSGWNVKRSLKQMVMSATYRQVSRASEDGLQRDPENEFLARASRYRLNGEFIRDQALSVSGLLVDKVGGPGVKPYQPPGLWNEVSLNGNLRFVRDKGQNLYRKSMYTYWKRSAPHPGMTIFDTPARDVCVVQRQRTNTPLQALASLNDVQYVEAARNLAQRVLLAESDFTARLDLAFMLCTAHPADDLRRGVMGEVLNAQLQVFEADPAAALALLGPGESMRDESLDPSELAAWTVLASMIQNLDETLTRE